MVISKSTNLRLVSCCICVALRSKAYRVATVMVVTAMPAYLDFRRERLSFVSRV